MPTLSMKQIQCIKISLNDVYNIRKDNLGIHTVQEKIELEKRVYYNDKNKDIRRW